MKTDDLIALLATETPAVDPRAPARRYALALLAGLAVATILVATGLGLRPDLAEAIGRPMFWLRLAYPVAIGLAAFWLVARLSRPGLRIGARWTALVAPMVVAWAGMAWILASAPADDRLVLLLGQSWRVCPILIALLSTPTFAGMFWAVGQMAPVRPRMTGAAIGLLAGATATVAYCLHCPEMAPPFWSTWYLLGMLLPGALGSLLGPRLLRW